MAGNDMASPNRKGQAKDRKKIKASFLKNVLCPLRYIYTLIPGTREHPSEETVLH
jgi:hypothetical protein